MWNENNCAPHQFSFQEMLCVLGEIVWPELVGLFSVLVLSLCLNDYHIVLHNDNLDFFFTIKLLLA